MLKRIFKYQLLNSITSCFSITVYVQLSKKPGEFKSILTVVILMLGLLLLILNSAYYLTLLNPRNISLRWLSFLTPSIVYWLIFCFYLDKDFNDRLIFDLGMSLISINLI